MLRIKLYIGNRLFFASRFALGMFAIGDWRIRSEIITFTPRKFRYLPEKWEEAETIFVPATTFRLRPRAAYYRTRYICTSYRFNGQWHVREEFTKTSL